MLFYALTIFLSAFLVFQIQPMIAKMILPWFGGTAAVWATWLLFFQAGRSGWPKMAQRRSVVSWTQRMPAGLPCGMPGMGVEMEGAIQQAPQAGRHSMGALVMTMIVF